MPYRAGATMWLGNREFRRGEVIPESIIVSIPYGRFGSLTRTGLLLEDLKATPAPEAEQEDSNICPVCGEGPYQRLARHMTKHDNALIEELEMENGSS